MTVPTKVFRLLTSIVVILAVIDSTSSLICHQTTVPGKTKAKKCPEIGPFTGGKSIGLVCAKTTRKKDGTTHSLCASEKLIRILNIKMGECADTSQAEMTADINGELHGRNAKPEPFDPYEELRVCVCNRDRCNDVGFNGSAGPISGGLVVGGAMIIIVWYSRMDMGLLGFN